MSAQKLRTFLKFRLPHPFVLLLAGVAIAAILTWFLPAGKYERRLDAATGREVVISGTYTRISATPVGPMAALMAVPRGIVAGADVIVVILFVGGAFALLEATGALGRLVSSLAGKARRPRLIVMLVCLAFATLGALDNMFEEIVALIPVLLALSRALGFGAITALSMSVGAAVVGAAFGPTNPFQTGIALHIAGLPPLSQPILRFSLLAAAVSIWVVWTLAMTSRDDVRPEVTGATPDPATGRDLLLLAVVLLPFVPYVVGILRYDWGFNELSALFLVVGFAIGLLSGRSLSMTAVMFLKGMETLLTAALFVGIARGISIVLQDGHILDTILYTLATPLSHMPPVAAAAMMVPVHALLHVPVPSLSGQAVLTMPIMAPLSDLLGISRDAAVIAYQTGCGLTEFSTPTSGALLAMLLSARVSFGRWLRFAVPGALLVSLVGFAGIVLAG
jgi:uncharacterized ion transporter superfamily protein YfcC